MNSSDISPLIRERAPLIRAAIEKAQNILLHCHPSPDPDSVGSALAMKYALEQMGKKATIIGGDSVIPAAFMHFPGAHEIIPKNFFEIDVTSFDLFIVLDGGSLGMISKLAPVVFPPSLKVIVIDHHKTNEGFGDVNLVESNYPANCQVLFDVFKEWNVKLDESIASNLFIGIYTDTGGFKFVGVTSHTLDIASELLKHISNVPQLIAQMQNSNTPGFLVFQGLAFSNIKLFCNKKIAISVVSHHMLTAHICPQEKDLCINFSSEDIRTSEISSFMRTVREWKITACAVETDPGVTKFSFRSGTTSEYDVSLLASSLGGGGHKYAAGLTVNKPADEAITLVVATVKELYNL
jgi:bifunctional oligoribonuclease and PAP phosphatase NrnA